jgi:hypothetical protein
MSAKELISANLGPVADTVKSLLTDHRVGLSSDASTNPILFLAQPVFVASYAALIAVSLFTSYMINKAGQTAFWERGSISYVVTLGFVLGFYVPAFFKIGASANDTKAVWHIAKPLIGGHLVLGLVNWVAAQGQTCDNPGQCAANTGTRKFFDTLIAPTRTMLSAAAPFNTMDPKSQSVEKVSGAWVLGPNTASTNTPGEIVATPFNGSATQTQISGLSSIFNMVVFGSPIYIALVFSFAAFILGLFRAK